MKIKFLYSVAAAKGGLQLHDQEVIIEIDGDPIDQWGSPSYQQLSLAEEEFRTAFLNRHNPNGHLIKYEAVPADGSKGLYSEYRAHLPS
jgi:hypothetical protein